MVNINLMAGINAARTLPDGQGVIARQIPGFVVRLESNRDDDDTFNLSILPLFAPPTVENPVAHWATITAVDVVCIMSAVIQFSERHFGPSGDEPVLVDLLDLEQFLRDQL